MNVSTSEPLSVDQVRILLAEGVDLCARYASSKLTVLDDDCDPDALQRRYGGTLQCSCPRVFDSVRDFEGHYANRHRLACVQCHTSLPTVHLLELHIAESHDPLFAAADRLKYQCVVEGCVERFASVSDRKQHAVEVHSPAHGRVTLGRMITRQRLHGNVRKVCRHITPPRSGEPSGLVKRCVKSRAGRPGSEDEAQVGNSGSGAAAEVSGCSEERGMAGD
ncbi:zinc finger protein 511 lethal (2) k10201 isoform X2 [Amblyomma americanum]